MNEHLAVERCTGAVPPPVPVQRWAATADHAVTSSRRPAGDLEPPTGGRTWPPNPEQHDARANPAKSSSGVTTQGA